MAETSITKDRLAREKHTNLFIFNLFKFQVTKETGKLLLCTVMQKHDWRTTRYDPNSN
jgi:hypothetical protein